MMLQGQDLDEDTFRHWLAWQTAFVYWWMAAATFEGKLSFKLLKRFADCEG